MWRRRNSEITERGKDGSIKLFRDHRSINEKTGWLTRIKCSQKVKLIENFLKKKREEDRKVS